MRLNVRLTVFALIASLCAASAGAAAGAPVAAPRAAPDDEPHPCLLPLGAGALALLGPPLVVSAFYLGALSATALGASSSDAGTAGSFVLGATAIVAGGAWLTALYSTLDAGPATAVVVAHALSALLGGATGALVGAGLFVGAGGRLAHSTHGVPHAILPVGVGAVLGGWLAPVSVDALVVAIAVAPRAEEE